MELMNAIFKAVGTVAENAIEAVASTTGNMDRGGDVIAPGAFKSAVLREFVSSGALLVGHEWDDLPVGYIESAKISGDQLISRAVFHSTPSAQEARTVAIERATAGKSVSVSVGFLPDYDSVEYHDSGAAMLKSCEEKGMDLEQFDTRGIKAWKYGCRLIRSVSELFEWSIVLVGMNPRAKAVSVKDFTGSAAHGLALETHLEVSLAGIQRAIDVAALRSESGRSLSAARLRIVEDINRLSGELLASKTKAEKADNDAAKAEQQRRAELLRNVEATLEKL